MTIHRLRDEDEVEEDLRGEKKKNKREAINSFIFLTATKT
jgi:hypothetical protein